MTAQENLQVVAGLSPQRVFENFALLSSIPHGSGNTKAISDAIADMARACGCGVVQDAVNNLILSAPASAGREGSAPVLLQGHIDMVCEKLPGCQKDMAREGLDLAVEGGKLKAVGTTLGGDDLIAAALALALVQEPGISHPPLEILLTVDEEVGMIGAAALDAAPIRARQMLNLDSEEEGVFTVGCAGGADALVDLPLRRSGRGGRALLAAIEGGIGGHSGIEIHHGRANAVHLLSRVLAEALPLVPFSLVSMKGGGKGNAIPVAAEAVLACEDPKALSDCLRMRAEAVLAPYRAKEPALSLLLSAAESTGGALSSGETGKLLDLVNALPDGVITMSASVPGSVETSLNLGIFTLGEQGAHAHLCVRSSVDAEKARLLDQLRSIAEIHGAAFRAENIYPAWEYRPSSPLRDRLSDCFTRLFGHPPRIETTHGGLECGVLAAKLPGLDCVSLGPELREIHTPRETLDIASVQRLWDLLLEVLR